MAFFLKIHTFSYQQEYVFLIYANIKIIFVSLL